MILKYSTLQPHAILNQYWEILSIGLFVKGCQFYKIMEMRVNV